MARVAWRNLPLWKKISSKINRIRRERGVTELQASERLEIPLKDYRKIERGQTESITLKQLADITDLLNVRFEEIIPFF